MVPYSCPVSLDMICLRLSSNAASGYTLDAACVSRLILSSEMPRGLVPRFILVAPTTDFARVFL